MSVFNILINNHVVETLEQKGQSREELGYIFMARVYALSSEYKTKDIDVVDRDTGESFYI